jgi:transitional endoplasmic reticulum ATPase
MAGGESEALSDLREAVRISPKNAPLRRALADALLGAHQAAEAEAEYRQGLGLAPDHTGLKFGLARAFYAQKKNGMALVMCEDLAKAADCPAKVHALYARVLAAMGEISAAAEQYFAGVAKDQRTADPTFASQLGQVVGSPDPNRESAAPDVSSADGGEADSYARTGEEPPNVGQAKPETLRADGAEPPPPISSAEFDRRRTTFADVGGLDELKEEIRLKIIYPLTHSDLYKAYGKAGGGGILLYGPPGCGKTHIARATAGEIQAEFLSVGINDVLDMWLGQSERKLHDIFEQARRRRPCVLFFDEVDALGASRSDMRHSASRHLINQFLSELDGVTTSNEGVLVLGATNAPWHLDNAFRRPGRFDRVLFVPPPDPPARAAILRLHLKGKPADGVDVDQIAGKTRGFSGADLRAVIDGAVEAKLRQAMKSGVPTPLRTKDLAASVSVAHATTAEWFATARNYALYANQGGQYDAVLKYRES